MIVLDIREQKLIEAFSKDESQITIKTLDVGDIHFTKNDMPVLIIERKTASDLSSSIIDGRYREQKARLLETKLPIIYVIEGDLQTKHGVPESTLWKAMIHTMLRDKCFVFRTNGLLETKTFLQQIYNSVIVKNMDLSGGIEKCAYTPIVSKRSKRSDPKVIYYCQLRAIPGVSESIANRIQEEFPDLPQLIKYINTNECKNVLDLIRLLPNGNRKIGPVVAKRIIESFLYIENFL